jgi:hypothetical protein
MILYTLRCGAHHEFEAWFRDGAAYDAQVKSAEIACPECGGTDVTKALMAPRLTRTRSEVPAAPVPSAEPPPSELRRALQLLRRHVEANCDYVGDRFADEARKIHKGESPSRGIYGEATDQESGKLAEEGVPVARIPWLPPNDA